MPKKPKRAGSSGSTSAKKPKEKPAVFVSKNPVSLSDWQKGKDSP